MPTPTNYWNIAIWCYLVVIVASFIPVLVAIFKKVKLNPGGSSFASSPHFSDAAKKQLEQHFSRLQGTLVFWKNTAEAYKRFHYYTLIWSIPISILIPIITQYVDSSFSSKLFLTIISTHIALVIGFHRALKVENHYKAFRHGESEFYDLYRQLLDRPESVGNTEEERLKKYFESVEVIRKAVRIAETDNLPLLDDVKLNENKTSTA